ncbi:MAG: hypothetical protein CML49_07960 [Rhodobacteraceae bacterium]|nr:MAG: hypothetical protein CML38_10890 [Paracoccaceae bacterium]PQM65310.1 MAG: hypothetical protein CML49_07960 [Paracoccaceae bacterium]
MDIGLGFCLKVGHFSVLNLLNTTLIAEVYNRNQGLKHVESILKIISTFYFMSTTQFDPCVSFFLINVFETLKLDNNFYLCFYVWIL